MTRTDFGLRPFFGNWGVAAVAAVAAGSIFFGTAAEGWAAPHHRAHARAKAAPAPAATAAPAAAPSGDSELNPDVAARQGIVLDYDTGKVLWEKNADQRMTPSSMSKLMTLYLVFTALKEGRLKLDSMLPVSEKAWRMQGSKMFVMLGTQVRVDDLLRGVIVDSGNDACVVLAEGLAGSEAAFAEQENEVAHKLGLTGSHFADASGWPDPNHYMTARDLATLSRDLIHDFSEYYHYFQEIDFTYGTNEKGQPIKQGNRNPLLYKAGLGVDGIKTGHTEDGGYGVDVSAIRNGQRVILVLNGMDSMKARSEESERLLEWAYREWGTYKLFKAGDEVDTADVWLGTRPTVKLVIPKDVEIAMLRRDRPKMKVTAIYDSPIPAPINVGQNVGKVEVTIPGNDAIDEPLVTAGAVNKLGFSGRMTAAFDYLVWGSGKK